MNVENRSETIKKITPEVLYQFLILKVLSDCGGKAYRQRVHTIIERDYGKFLSKKDLEEYNSGNAIRWKNHVDFAREHLKKDGYLMRGSSYGLWEVSEEGKKQLKAWLEMVQQNK